MDVNSGESESISNLQILETLGHDYASYVSINTEKERTQFDEQLESLLTKLEEYCALVDIIRSDTSLCLNKTLPQIYVKAQELQEVFEKIDRLEVFVERVKKNLSEVEVLLEQAESEVVTKSPVAKFFSSLTKPGFFSSNKSQSQSPKKFIRPVIFRTEDYLGPSKSAKAKPGQGTAGQGLAQTRPSSDQNKETSQMASGETKTGEPSSQTGASMNQDHSDVTDVTVATSDTATEAKQDSQQS